MKKKHYLLIRGILFGAMALFSLSLPLWASLSDNTGVLVAIIISAVFAYISYRCFQQIKKTRDEERAYAPPIDATQPQQLNFYKRYLYLGLIAFPLLTIIIISDLNDLESGKAQSVSLFAPTAFVYEQFGYWPAILFVPVLGVIVFLLLLKKIRSIKSSNH